MWDRAPIGSSRRASFLSGTITVYGSDQCEAAGSSTQVIGADGYVHTALGEVVCAGDLRGGSCGWSGIQGTAAGAQSGICTFALVWHRRRQTRRFRRAVRLSRRSATNTLIPPTNTANPADPVGSAGDRRGAAV